MKHEKFGGGNLLNIRDVHIQRNSGGRHSDSLLMPVIDLVDISKHNPVLSSQVLRNALITHGGHVTLYKHKHVSKLLISIREINSFAFGTN